MEGWLVTVGRSQAESNLKGYEEDMCGLWVSASVMGGVIQTDRITARSNFGESTIVRQNRCFFATHRRNTQTVAMLIGRCHRL